MPDDPRDIRTRKTPPDDVARAMTSGGVPREFAEGDQPITGVGLSPIEEINLRARRIQTTTDATATTITGQLAEHGKEIKRVEHKFDTKFDELNKTVGGLSTNVAGVAVAMPLLTTAVQELTASAIQRETVTTTTQIEISGAKQIAEVEINKSQKVAKIERGTKIYAIVASLVALALAALELLR